MLGKKREPGPFVDRVKRAQEMRLRQPGRSPSQQRRRKREACCGIAGHSGLPCRPLTANAKKFKAHLQGRSFGVADEQPALLAVRNRAEITFVHRRSVVASGGDGRIELQPGDTTSPATRSGACTAISTATIAPIEKPMASTGPSVAASARAAIAAMESSRVRSASVQTTDRSPSTVRSSSPRPLHSRASHMFPDSRIAAAGLIREAALYCRGSDCSKTATSRGRDRGSRSGRTTLKSPPPSSGPRAGASSSDRNCAI